MGFRSVTIRQAAPLALTCLLVGALPAPAATPATGTSPATSTALFSAKVLKCQRGTSPVTRTATFRGGMKRVPGATRLSMRFTLRESVGHARYHALVAPGLGVWRTSRPGVGAFAYRQKVKALVDGSAYAVAVDYRWQDDAGKVLKTAHARSAACRQNGPLPNLKVQRIGGRATAGGAQPFRYALTVINAGTARSEGSSVALTVDGVSVGRATVPAIEVGQLRRVYLPGPQCVGTVRAEVDVDGVIRETNEIDNGRSTGCPGS